MSSEKLLSAVADLKRRAAMISYANDKAAATKDLLTDSIAVMEQLAQAVVDLDRRRGGKSLK